MQNKPKLGGAIYVLPNLITTGNLFFGFFSIIKALQGDFKLAASAIMIAGIFDVLDGRVARLTGGTSEFGVQYDSLCDLISFGLAPSLLAYQFNLNAAGRLGWIVCFLYLACGALRLARFNVQTSIGKDKGDFIGLPIPMAAGLIACFVATLADHATNDFLARIMQSLDPANQKELLSWLLGSITPTLGILMVSNLPYRSHKVLKFTGLKPFKMLVVSIVIVAFIAFQPELFGFLAFLSYAASGAAEWALGWKKAVDEDELFESDERD